MQVCGLRLVAQAWRGRAAEDGQGARAAEACARLAACHALHGLELLLLQAVQRLRLLLQQPALGVDIGGQRRNILLGLRAWGEVSQAAGPQSDHIPVDGAAGSRLGAEGTHCPAIRGRIAGGAHLSQEALADLQLVLGPARCVPMRGASQHPSVACSGVLSR
jgi:hypothetical protein